MKLVNKSFADKQDEVIEQYKLYVEMTDRISQRRANTNTYFLTVNSFIIGILTINYFNINRYGVFISAVGMILSFIWYKQIKNYRMLNTGKYQVINKMEEILPFKLYQYEWKILGEGKDKSKYHPITFLEEKIPILFGVIYLVLAHLILV